MGSSNESHSGLRVHAEVTGDQSQTARSLSSEPDIFDTPVPSTRASETVRETVTPAPSSTSAPAANGGQISSERNIDLQRANVARPLSADVRPSGANLQNNSTPPASQATHIAGIPPLGDRAQTAAGGPFRPPPQRPNEPRSSDSATFVTHMDNILEKGSFPGLAADSEVSVLGEMPVLGQSTRRGSRVAAKASIGMLRAGVAPEVNPWDLAEQDRIERSMDYLESITRVPKPADMVSSALKSALAVPMPAGVLSPAPSPSDVGPPPSSAQRRPATVPSLGSTRVFTPGIGMLWKAPSGRAMLVSQGTTRPVTREGWGGSDLPTARKRATESAATRPVTRQAPATPTDLAGFRSPPFLLMDPGFEPERVRDTAEGLPDDPWFRDWYEGQVRSSSPSAGMRQGAIPGHTSLNHALRDATPPTLPVPAHNERAKTPHFASATQSRDAGRPSWGSRSPDGLSPRHVQQGPVVTLTADGVSATWQRRPGTASATGARPLGFNAPNRRRRALALSNGVDLDAPPPRPATAPSRPLQATTAFSKTLKGDSYVRAVKALDCGQRQSVRGFPHVPTRVITRMEVVQLLRSRRGQRVKDQMINLSLEEIDRMLMVYDAAVPGSGVNAKARMEIVEAAKKRVAEVFEKTQAAVRKEWQRKWVSENLAKLRDEAEAALAEEDTPEEESAESTIESDPDMDMDDLHNLAMLRERGIIEGEQINRRAEAMELLQQEWDMDQSLRGAEQDGLRLKMAKVNRMGLVRGLVKGPQAKANAAWLNSKTGMGPEAAKQILTEKADAIGRKLAEAHASDLAASYSAMQAHKSLPPHEQHLARPDSLVHKMPPLNMTLYHEMMRFQPPNMQELYRGGGL